MRIKKTICLSLLSLFCIPLFSQVKTLQAIKTSQAPKIDGNLDDAAWITAPSATDFIQNYPSFGVPASRKTNVKIVYDNSAIYIGAHLYDEPVLISRQLTARDAEQLKNVDYFSVFLDTYGDKQNGFQFTVTAANVQTDARLSPSATLSAGVYGDVTWDAVWESKVQMQRDGWSVEIKIPYSSLRFAKKDIQDWGIQFMRLIRRTNEICFWNPVDPQVNGFVNQFGDYKGLENLHPPLRLSFSPYVSTGYRSTPQTTGYTDTWLRSGGMDVKYGINESFTLDATIIPDYGQVVSDNVVNNLTPYEIKFQENRQFFTEGTELFNKAGLFYSRRIGATPPGFYSVLDTLAGDPNLEEVKNPTVTQLYNAIKFSGRTSKKLGIGFFNAIAASSDAIIRNKTTGAETKIETSPLTNYNILVLDQALKGRSSLTFTNTNVMRNGNSRDANVSAFDVALYNKSNTYALNGTARYSKIWGTNPYDGYNTTLKYGKVSGKWRYYVLNNITSKVYDPNDLGILASPNLVTYKANVSYRQLKPTNNFIQYTYTLDNRVQYLYKPYAFGRYDITGSADWIFKNFWEVVLLSQLTPFDSHDYFELRTDGRYINYPLNYVFQLNGNTDGRKKLYIRYGGSFARSPKFDNNYYGVSFGFNYRFSNKFSLDFQEDAHKETNSVGYAFTREANGDPITAYRDVKEYTSVLSGIYNFTRRLNITLRVRHYWNEVKYLHFHDVDANGNLTNRPFINNWDENINIFNADAFLTWDFRLGSKLIIGYKNKLGDDEYVPITSHNSYFDNFKDLFNLKHGNEFTARFIYFLDYNQLRKKR
jgi:hypothetical protein